MSKRKLEATRANQARKGQSGRRVPPGTQLKTARRDRRRLIAAVVVGLAAIGIALGFTIPKVTGGGGGGGTAVNWASLPGLQSGPPPWTPGLDQLTPRLDAIGLQQLGAEGEVIHIHQHLDIWFDGKKVQVPADIGINETYGYLTELHTHDTSGVMHVESPTKRSFTLGEFFAVWGVRLTSSCLGSTCNAGGRQVRVYVDGKQLTTPPDELVLKAHQEIVVTYGTAAQLPHPVPSSYRFPAGL